MTVTRTDLARTSGTLVAANSSPAPAVEVYDSRLNGNAKWALSEASAFFEGQGAVQESLHRIAGRLDELGIPYAVAGGLALFSHGFRRFTEDVDILVTAAGLTALHQSLGGLGYVAAFKGSRNLRDSASGVRIEFLVSGQYPGDGMPKPVAFPDPRSDMHHESEFIDPVGKNSEVPPLGDS